MILEKINNKTLEDVKKREEKISLDELENIIADGNFPTKDVKKFLKSSIDEPIRIIAEVKKASPSKGVIKEDFDHLQIAKEYNDFGANAISILTEPHFFLGNLDYLKEIKNITNIPLLRKDFILTKYQIAEALIYGADFILLIAKSLSQDELNELYSPVPNLYPGHQSYINCSELELHNPPMQSNPDGSTLLIGLLPA